MNKLRKCGMKPGVVPHLDGIIATPSHKVPEHGGDLFDEPPLGNQRLMAGKSPYLYGKIIEINGTISIGMSD